jgi:tetratricopeptide (TPR) repeat protein
MQGDIDRALESNERAQQLEPLWLAPKGAAGNFLYFARRYDESIRLLERVLALDERADNARSVLIRDLLVTGEYDRAITEYDKRPLQFPGSKAHRAQALALSGQRAAALVELDRVLKLSKERYVAAYDIALIYAALGDTENTFLWLDRAVEDRSTPMVCRPAVCCAGRAHRGLSSAVSANLALLEPSWHKRPLFSRGGGESRA